MEVLARENIHRFFYLLMAVLVLTGSTYARHIKKGKDVREKQQRHSKHPDLKCEENKKTREKQKQLAKG